jgi:hypothetical protein
MKVFVDMDGVLVDFIKGLDQLTGRKGPYPPGEYDLTKVYGPTIWLTLVNVGWRWWKNLDKTPESDAIMKTLNSYDSYICSTPTEDPSCIKGKLAWIQLHYPHMVSRYVFTPRKSLLAAGNILIDDSDMNCSDWTLSGGYSFLVPRSWNVLHRYPFLTITLGQWLETLTRIGPP